MLHFAPLRVAEKRCNYPDVGGLDASERILTGIPAEAEDDPLDDILPSTDIAGLPIWNGLSDLDCTVDGSNLFFFTPSTLPCGTSSQTSDPEVWYVEGVVRLPAGATSLSVSTSNEHPVKTPRQSGVYFYSALSDNRNEMMLQGGGLARVNNLTRVSANIPIPLSECVTADGIAFRMYVYDASGNHASRLSWRVVGGSEDTAGTWASIPVSHLSTFGGFNNDLDASGIADYIEADTDNDGISDWVESGEMLVSVFPGTDGDSQADCLDPDSDNDGLPDALEASSDTDGDSLPDFRDRDSDNDGILDGIESGITGLDSDNDGIDNRYDVDSTGGNDSNNNGIDDAVELSGALDTDGDDIPDYLDLDSDNDGISDLYESGADNALDADNNGTIAGAEFSDTDADGLSDDIEVANGQDSGTIPLNSDSDSLADYIDLDSDADDIPDTVEARATAGYAVNDGDVTDDDNDNDGVIALFDTNDGTVGDYGGNSVNFNNPVNTDGDSTPDYLDVDSDNDSETDLQEGEVQVSGGFVATTPPSYADPDGSINNPLGNSDGSDLLENDDADSSEVDYRSDRVAPVATAASVSAGADAIATVDLSSNVSDANNDIDISTIDLDPSAPGIQNSVSTSDGVWNVDATGTLTFDPNSTFEGIATIPYTVSDDDGNVSPSAIVSVSVAGARPVVTADSVSVGADALATVNLSDNVTDANNDIDITTIDLVPSTPGIQNSVTTSDGEWSVDATGSLTFDPDSAFEGIATIPYTVSDDDGNVAPASTVSVSVAGAIPVATTDSASVGADALASVDLSDNVTDANNDIDITTIDLDPSTPGIQNSVTTSDGVWSVDATGSLSFDPDSAFEGTASIPYTVSDDDGNVALGASVSVTVAGATPVVTADSVSVGADVLATVDLSDNVSDANNDIDITTINLDPSTPGVQSSVTNSEGVWSVDATGSLTFDPASTFEGTATIPYTVSDDDGNVASASTVSVSVAGAIPVATTNNVSVGADALASVDLSDNVSDANNDIDITTIDLDPSTPGVQSSVTTSEGVWSVDATGSLTFDPDSAFEGTATIPYTVSDDDGNVAPAAIVSVSVAGAIPVATTDNVSVGADALASVDLSDNVSDANNDIDITTVDLDPATPGVQTVVTTADGVWSVDATGSLSFDPASTFEGNATITYTVADDDGNVALGASVSVTVAGATPVVTADSISVGADALATVDLSDNVSDANNDIDITTIDLDPSTPGVQSSVTNSEGVWSVDATGSLTFDPASTFEGTATIAYTVADDDGNVAPAAIVSVSVAGAIPVATTNNASVGADALASVDLSDNVTDANNDIDFATVDLDPAIPGVQSTLTTAEGLWTVEASGVVSFNPVSSFEGTTTISYTVSDNGGNVSNISNLSVTVAGATPAVTADSASVDADTNAVVNLADNVSDANSDIDIATIDLDPTTAGIQNTLTTADGEWSVDSTGTLTFDPLASFQGTSTISYTVQDDDGNVSAAADVSVTVAGAAPFADAETETTDQDTNVTIDVLDGDTDANGNLDPSTLDLDPDTAGVQTTYTIPGEGDFSVIGNQVIFDPFVTFTGMTAFTYTVADTDGNLSNIAQVSIAVDVLPDADGDGIPNISDLDDDNDGIPDSVEGTDDSDGDGVIDSLDRDSDNDGITDSIEAGGSDADGNGILDGFIDLNLDGLDDTTALASLPIDDSDGDGLADYRDVDSDNDGLTDSIEAGGADAEGNGTVDGFTDTNGDGLDDATATTPLPVSDTDGDGLADFIDLDTDNDGIADTVEVGGIDADGNGEIDGFVDENGDGLTDSTPLAFLDSDNDGVANVRDLDSDNDGISDTTEAGGTDLNGDGLVDNFIDLNGDGLADTGALPARDTDADGNPDYQDADADNDGLTDTIEAGGTDANGDGVIDNFIDTDNNGLDDNVAVLPVTDTDGDGAADFIDGDSDNDGISDTTEAGGSDTNHDGVVDGFTDVDGNGLDDATALTPLTGADTDGNGDVNHRELDSDQDGIPDAIEGSNDTDGDGVPDYLDPDSDNDGILDTVEAPVSGVDSDNDGIDDSFDVDATGGTDANNNGIDDAIENAGVLDTDNDGIPDYLDLDSDNDGISDAAEAGGNDADGNGITDLFTDSDGDGLDDAISVLPLTAEDTDNDGIADYLDLDSDNDGITDTTESGGTDVDGNGVPDSFNDTDGNGLNDAGSPTLQDSDADGNPDYLDIDSDNDGITDATETGGLDVNGDGALDDLIDNNNDGLTDTNPAQLSDTNGNGTPDYLELDSDGDGIPDNIEAGANGGTPTDSNGDGTPDYQQLDSDADGIPDSFEAGADGTSPTDSDGDGIPDYRTADSDSDGISDSVEAGPDGTAPTDTDGDTIPDYRERDSDNDGISDAIEAGVTGGSPIDTDADGIADFQDLDADNDGIPDTIEAGSDLSGPTDTDGDGKPDFLDVDSDNDGISDGLEVGDNAANPVDSDGNGTPDFLEPNSDRDGDGLSDGIEGIMDTDGDGVADYLDIDSDDDGIEDSIEAEFDGEVPADRDQDGVFDYLDIDSDNDGISDAREGGEDTDQDGVRNFRDLDVDNDGIVDIIEARIGMQRVNELDTNLDGSIDPAFVFGPNGMADEVETQPESGEENYELPDIDSDTVLDYRDRDSDNDGLLDTLESDHVDLNLDGVIDTASIGSVAVTHIRTTAAVAATGLADGAGGVPRNTDGDALADFRDGDSDNDGLTDASESFGPLSDEDGNGQLDDFFDQDGDGIDDTAAAIPVLPADTDNDGMFDAVEIDADADGISDLVETGGIDANNDGVVDNFQDADGDGIDDSIEILPLISIDSDNDNTPDFQDLDSDNDGLSDIQESGGIDANGDGIADGLVNVSDLPDENGDGIPDFMQIDNATGASQPEPSEGRVLTGLSGHGCTLIGSARGVDPLFPGVLLLSLLWLGRRRCKEALEGR